MSNLWSTGYVYSQTIDLLKTLWDILFESGYEDLQCELCRWQYHVVKTIVHAWAIESDYSEVFDPSLCPLRPGDKRHVPTWLLTGGVPHSLFLTSKKGRFESSSPGLLWINMKISQVQSSVTGKVTTVPCHHRRQQGRTNIVYTGIGS